ncbi:MAG: hypothetical protein K6G71_05980 [Clostridiales bacterium]|nr:hypothetical protein [Clostridiales bacterium]
MTDKDTAAPAAADARENKQNTKPRVHLTMGAVVLIAFFVLLALATVNYIRNNNSGSRAGVPSVTETTAVGQTAAATKAAAITTAKDKAGNEEREDETENAVSPTFARPAPPTERRTEEPSGEVSETEAPTDPEETSEPPAETTLTEPEGETAESGE